MAGKTKAAAESSSTTATAATPPKAEVRKWGDEELDVEDPAAAGPSSSEDKGGDDLKRLEGLRIRDGGEEEEEPGRRSEGLDEPKESPISAVTSGDTVYTSAVSSEDLNLSKEYVCPDGFQET